jgi:hypothetical protein
MRTRSWTATAFASALVLAAGIAPAAHASDEVDGADIAAIRAATAQYKVFDEAALTDAGYVLKLPDGDGVTYCIDDPDVGGMGIHYVNTASLTPGFDLTEPEVLVYEPGLHGEMRLVAVEFVVFEADLASGAEPSLLGQDLERAPGPDEPNANRYGLPAFYELHVWAWKHNPLGMFEDYNPKVSCSHLHPVQAWGRDSA